MGLNARRHPVQTVGANQTPATMHGEATVGTLATQPTPATQLETAGEVIANNGGNTGNSWNQPQPTQAPTQNTGGGMFGGLFGGMNTGNNFFQPNQGNNLFAGGQQNANPFQYIFG